MGWRSLDPPPPPLPPAPREEGPSPRSASWRLDWRGLPTGTGQEDEGLVEETGQELSGREEAGWGCVEAEGRDCPLFRLLRTVAAPVGLYLYGRHVLSPCLQVFDILATLGVSILLSHFADEEGGAQKVNELAEETQLVCGQLGAGPVSWGRWMSNGVTWRLVVTR